MTPLLRLLRPHQYAKNLLVFSAPGAAGRLDEASVVWLTCAAFALFCAVSSAGYVLNDLLDVDADRQHPTKQHRPIASGSVSPQVAVWLIAGLGGFALALALLIGWPFAIVLAIYAAITSSYSTVLKRVPWVELLAVSSGFVLRAIGGGTATDTPLSSWFLLVVSGGALLMITGKRLGELLSLGNRSPSRRVLARYRPQQLRAVAVVAAVVAVGGYVAWAAAEASEQAADSAGSMFLRLTALPFAVAMGRYLVLSWRGDGETPEALIVRDRIVFSAGLCWTALYAIGIYA